MNPTVQVLDHSGVAFAIPGIYDTRDHDLHHSAVSANYSFPFPCMDIVHSTYEGVWCGRRYRAKGLRALKRDHDEQNEDSAGRRASSHAQLGLSSTLKTS